jgi:RNA-binding protein
MSELTNPQIRKLKALAQRLDPVIHLGRAGLSEAFLRAVNEELDRHELIKLRFDDFKDQRKELAPQIAAQTNSQLVWIVGHVAVFYREQPDPAKRKIPF